MSPASSELAAPAQDQQNWPSPSEPLRWLALGDSFSSGEGTRRTSGDCHRSDGAYAPVAAELLENDGFPVTVPELVACSGAEILANPNSGSALDLEAQIDLAEGTFHPAGSFDLITLTAGGNDAGFGNILTRCLTPEINQEGSGLPWLVQGCWQLMRGFDVWEQLRQEHPDVDTAYDPFSFQMNYSPGDDVWESLFDIFYAELIASMKLGLIEINLTDMLQRLVEEQLADSGQIILLGYPPLFEHSSNWDSSTNIDPFVNDLSKVCSGIVEHFANRFRDAARELNTTLQAAANAYDEVHYLNVFETFEGHNLCSDSDDVWINGITVGLTLDTWPPVHGRASYHPNQGGYNALAYLLAEYIKGLPWDGGSCAASNTSGPEDPDPGDREPPPDPRPGDAYNSIRPPVSTGQTAGIIPTASSSSTNDAALAGLTRAGAPTQLESKASEAYELVYNFFDALERGDYREAAGYWTGYPVPGAEDARSRARWLRDHAFEDIDLAVPEDRLQVLVHPDPASMSPVGTLDANYIVAVEWAFEALPGEWSDSNTSRQRDGHAAALVVSEILGELKIRQIHTHGTATSFTPPPPSSVSLARSLLVNIDPGIAPMSEALIFSRPRPRPRSHSGVRWTSEPRFRIPVSELADPACIDDNIVVTVAYEDLTGVVRAEAGWYWVEP